MSGDAVVTLISGLIAVSLTLLVFSRLLGDNPAFRMVQYLFVGLSLGYAFVVVYHQILRPNTLAILTDLNNPSGLMLRLVPWFLALLLLPRLFGRQKLSWLANIPLAILFGVGTALAVGGTIVGTLVPQVLDSIRPTGSDPVQVIGSVLLVLGVVVTLSYFYFTLAPTTRSGQLIRGSARVGRWFLIVAFGFFLAGGLLTYLTALNERLEFIVTWLRAPLG
ncbi:hypothetical protein EYB53_006855 [Candidatus Chloroploca sp. M-50]|uniref:Uncharacterized protein n=1 Tax=Candidatus Chloroploca mongolica TaxID=2528176 RepID=A0ABS4D7J8_9CHLR|nr:hypothetical protein [Candidatus Chloroploca mongolica]MBP1465421.1 hypothetical protein [Candidatus Chloroploca mongolica]